MHAQPLADTREPTLAGHYGHPHSRKDSVRPHIYNNHPQQGNGACGRIWAIYSIAVSPWGLSPAAIPTRGDTREEHMSQPHWDI